MTGRHRRLTAGLIATASFIALGGALSGCGAGTHPPTAKSASSSPSAVSTNDLLLTKADLPDGFEAFTPKTKPRPFCGRTASITPTSKAAADFAMPSNNTLTEIHDAIATYSSAARARAELADAQLLLTTSCHLDVTSHGRDAITVVPTPPLGGTSLGVRQVVTDAPPLDGMTFSSFEAYTYYVLDGSAILEVGILDVTAADPRTASDARTAPDLAFLKRLTLLQLKRFNSKTPAPGLSV
jgi:hypothetical protein